MNLIYRVLLSIASTSLLVSIFLIKSKVYIYDFDDNFFRNLSLLTYFFIPVALTFFVVYLTKYLGKDEFLSNGIVELEYAGNSFLPSYLGYFFVALSVSDKDFFTIMVLYSILFLFVFLSKTFYFNPIFLLFGYHFYQVKTNSGLKVFFITKKTLRKPSDIDIQSVYRINDFTFIER